MTRAEYEAKYGTKPQTTSTPVKMTRAEYEAKYNAPATPEQKPALLDRILNSSISKGIQSIFPGKKLGEAVGTSVASIQSSLRGDVPEATRAIDASAPKPLQVGADVANAIITPASMALAPVKASTVGMRILGNTVLGAEVAGAQSGFKTLSQGGTKEEVNKNTLLGMATGGFLGGATSAFGELFRASGDKILNTVIKPSQHDMADGFRIDTIKKYNLGGSLDTMADNTESKLNALSQQLNEKLKANPTKINTGEALRETIQKLSGNKLKNFGSNTSMDKALEQLQAEITALGDTNVSIPDAQLIKQASGKMGSWLFGAPDPDANARQKVYDSFYNILKTQIEKASPEGVKEINKQLSELIPVQNAIIRRLPIADRNNLLSLQDVLTLTASAMNPAALSGFALSIAQKSGAVGNALSKLGPKLSKLVPTIGSVGGQVVPAINSSQSQVDQRGKSLLPKASVDTTTLSPEVQRIINMSR